MQRRVGFAVDHNSKITPLGLEMFVVDPTDNASTEALIALIARECLVSCIVDEKQEIFEFGLYFFICVRMHVRLAACGHRSCRFTF